ncbi:MAG: S24 family peptidase [Desulfovibrionaceae bacterium]
MTNVKTIPVSVPGGLVGQTVLAPSEARGTVENYPTELYERVRLYIEKKGLSQGDLAQVLDLPVRKFNYYLTEKSQVNLWPLLVKLLEHDKKLSRTWLYFGEGDMWTGQVQGQTPPPPAAPQLPALDSGTLLLSGMPFTPTGNPLRLTALADCGKQGWCNRTYKSVSVSPPHCGADWIAVLTIGDSMLPYGIREGYTLFCDPAQSPAEGEAVYALRRDGSATIKIYKGRDAAGCIVLQHWTPAVGGVQKPYLDACPWADIALLAPVIYMKCRL